MGTSKLLNGIKRKMHIHVSLRLITLCIAAILLMLLLITRTTISNVSAVEAVGVGVYWDSDCQNQVFSIDWGTLHPGMTKELTVYMRNERNESAVLWLTTDNWDPPNASEYMTLSWTYMGQTLEPREVLKLEFILAVSPEIEGITNFHFYIMVQANNASEALIGDANGDGRVNGADLGIVGASWYKCRGDPNYDPRADFNGDGLVNGVDLGILALNWFCK